MLESSRGQSASWGGWLVRTERARVGSTAMLYSARGARLALRSLERGYMHPLDAHLGSLAGPKFRFLQLIPPVVVERPEVSQIGSRAGFAGGTARPSGRRAALQPVFNRVLRLSGSVLRRLGARATAGGVGRRPTQPDPAPQYIPITE